MNRPDHLHEVHRSPRFRSLHGSHGTNL